MGAQRRKETRSAVIIGSGLGGLLTGAFLASHGWQVTVLEALSLLGGRFTHIDFEGFAVPTGAFHAFPGGRSGPLARCLALLGIEVDLAEPTPCFQVTVNDMHFPLDLRASAGSGLTDALGAPRRRQILRHLAPAVVAGLLGRDCSVASALAGLPGGEQLLPLFDHLTSFAIGVPAAATSLTDLVRALWVQRFAREGFLRQGNRGLIDALAGYASRHGATILPKTRATGIAVKGGTAVGVQADGHFFPADLVIANIGRQATIALLNGASIDFHDTPMTPAWGASHAIRSRLRLSETASIDIPLALPHIAGIAPISTLCPALAPPGWHYSLAYQVLDQGRDVDAQLAAGTTELQAYLGSTADIFNIAVYRGEHPAALVAPSLGQGGRLRPAAIFPGVRQLYLAGHDVRGVGIAAEIIGDSCRRLWRTLT